MAGLINGDKGEVVRLPTLQLCHVAVVVLSHTHCSVTGAADGLQLVGVGSIAPVPADLHRVVLTVHLHCNTGEHWRTGSYKGQEDIEDVGQGYVNNSF